MVTLMTWETSGGKKGRCNATCHNAKHDKCACMCGGKFHGSARQEGGVQQALDEHWDEVIGDAARKAEQIGITLETERWGKNRQKPLPLEAR